MASIHVLASNAVSRIFSLVFTCRRGTAHPWLFIRNRFGYEGQIDGSQRHRAYFPDSVEFRTLSRILPQAAANSWAEACKPETPLMLARLKIWAHSLRQEVHAIYLAARDPRVPWYAKALAMAVAAYALSPIDLIPDFIPVLGYVDDLILVPLGVWATISLIPAEVLAEYRAVASRTERPVSRVAAVVIVMSWILSGAALTWVAIHRWA
jgi:uncharacterized membrane protein YkvA (DUF1232 family)